MKVLVALSGGVDSSVAAALMVEAGHEVAGVTLKLWGGDSDSGCCSVSDVDDARRVAQQLGIDHYVFNFGSDFDRYVVEPYLADHVAGLTPNPCVECNRHIKFDRLLERCDVLGFDRLVTGHHVKLVDTDAGPRLARSADDAKDQSYVLHMIPATDLARCWFPLGEMTKTEVREHAERLGLRTAAKPDSQDVCFITKSAGRSNFMTGRIDLHSADLVDTDGTVVGQTSEVELITIGQRRGLDLGGSGERRYAVNVDVPGRKVTIGTAADLMCSGVLVSNLAWADGPVEGPVQVQVSAHGKAMAGELDGDGHVRWLEPQRRVAPGQAVVFYRHDDVHGDIVLGGGTAAGHLET